MFSVIVYIVKLNRAIPPKIRQCVMNYRQYIGQSNMFSITCNINQALNLSRSQYSNDDNLFGARGSLT